MTDFSKGEASGAGRVGAQDGSASGAPAKTGVAKADRLASSAAPIAPTLLSTLDVSAATLGGSASLAARRSSAASAALSSRETGEKTIHVGELARPDPHTKARVATGAGGGLQPSDPSQRASAVAIHGSIGGERRVSSDARGVDGVRRGSHGGSNLADASTTSFHHANVGGAAAPAGLQGAPSQLPREAEAPGGGAAALRQRDAVSSSVPGGPTTTSTSAGTSSSHAKALAAQADGLHVEAGGGPTASAASGERPVTSALPKPVYNYITVYAKRPDDERWKRKIKDVVQTAQRHKVQARGRTCERRALT